MRVQRSQRPVRMLARPRRFMRYFDAILRDRLTDDFLINASLRCKRGKRRDRDVSRVDLKEAAKRCTRVAAPETVGSERDEWRLDISRDQLRIGPHIVR